MFDTLKEAWRIVRDRNAVDKDIQERANIAQAFNDRYTYRKEYDTSKPRLTQGTAMYGVMPKGGFAWMCPTCNKIHHPVESSSMTGLQYPSCCSHHYGNRLYDKIRVE